MQVINFAIFLECKNGKSRLGKYFRESKVMKLNYLGLILLYVFTLNGSNLGEPKQSCCKQAALYSCIGCCKMAKYSCLCCGICYWAIATGITSEFSVITNQTVKMSRAVGNLEEHIKEQLAPKQHKYK